MMTCQALPVTADLVFDQFGGAVETGIGIMGHVVSLEGGSGFQMQRAICPETRPLPLNSHVPKSWPSAIFFQSQRHTLLDVRPEGFADVQTLARDAQRHCGSPFPPLRAETGERSPGSNVRSGSRRPGRANKIFQTLEIRPSEVNDAAELRRSGQCPHHALFGHDPIRSHWSCDYPLDLRRRRSTDEGILRLSRYFATVRLAM